MKKSSVIIIALIFVGAIISINFYGLKLKIFDPTIYVKSVICTNEEATLREGGENEYDIILLWEENLQYELKCRALPETANKKDLVYTFETVKDIEVKRAGVVFREKGGVKIYVKSNDGSNKGITINIYAI